MRTAPKNERGFTIIELIIAVGIIGFLVAAIFIVINPAKRISEARDNQREVDLQAIQISIDQKMRMERGWNCPVVPEELTRIGSHEYDLYECIYPEYLSDPLHDPIRGNWEDENNYDTGYYIAMDPRGDIYLAAKGETRMMTGEWSCGRDFIDHRDGKIHKTVRIGQQCWIQENLDYEGYADGNSWCYENESSNCDNYGRLYDWEAAMLVCPDGWILPSDEDFKELEMELGMSEEEADEIDYRGTNEGDKLKCSDYGWCDSVMECGESGFDALPGGIIISGEGEELLGTTGSWWTSTDNSNQAWRRVMESNKANILRETFEKSHGLSVRCLKND